MDVALDYGYGSHEGFTRAFKAHFGKTPEEVRRAESVTGLALREAIRFVQAPRAKLGAARFERTGELKFIGLAEPFTYGEVEHIPNQWRRFMADFYPSIEHKNQSIPTGIVTTGADGEADLSYTCAIEVSRFSAAPAGLVNVTVKPASYVVFAHNQHVSELSQTYAAIWNDWLPANGHEPAEAPSLEKPNATFDTRTGEGGLTVWIPLAQ